MPASAPILEVHDLVKQYPSVTAVDGVSFAVPEGICFGLLGPNGAGKTTTIEIMEGILPPSSGEVRYRGEPRGRALPRGGRHPLPEDRAAGLPHACARAWRSFAASTSTACDVDEVLEAVRAREARRPRQPQALRRPAAAPAARDRAGERSARCCSWMSRRPDSTRRRGATSGSWSQSIKAQRKTIILTTHYMEEAQLLCDEIAIMDRGRIIAQGAPQRLLREHFAEVLLELPRHEFPDAARQLPLKLIDASDRVEISTHDIDGTLRTLIEARRPVCAICASARPTSRTSSSSSRARSCARDEATARRLACAQPRVPARPPHSALHAAAAGGHRGRHGIHLRRPAAAAVQSRRARHGRQPLPIPSSHERYVQFVPMHDEAPGLDEVRTSESICSSILQRRRPRPLLGQYRLAEGLHRREAAPRRRPRRARASR